MTATTELPRLIQGGMGVGVSNWRLANAVARTGQLGVVSATVIDTLMVRRLQDGDPDGDMRRAIACFPDAAVAEAVLKRYYIEGGKAPGAPYALLPLYRQRASVSRQQVTMLASFVEVWLAKEGHDGQVGINVLTKVQFPNLAVLYGAVMVVNLAWPRPEVYDPSGENGILLYSAPLMVTVVLPQFEPVFAEAKAARQKARLRSMRDLSRSG